MEVMRVARKLRRHLLDGMSSLGVLGGSFRRAAQTLSDRDSN